MRSQDVAMAGRKPTEALSPFDEACELIDQMRCELKDCVTRLRIEKAFGQAIIAEITISKAEAWLRANS